MKKLGLLIFILLNANFALAAVPKDDPFFSTGTDFLVTKWDDSHSWNYQFYYHHPAVFSLFNDTNIFIDSNDDGVWEYRYTKNAGEWLNFEVLPIVGIINNGARIHADKPVLYRQYLAFYAHSCGYQCTQLANSEIFVPQIPNLKNDYLVYNTTWAIVSPETITVNIDLSNDGVVDNTINISKLNKADFTVPEGNFARVYSDKPFYLYNSISTVGPSGNDFYIQHEVVSKLVISEDNTTVQVDLNNDGHYDNTTNYSKGVYGPFAYNNGAHIHSDKPIAVFVYEGEYVMPQDMVGSDAWGYSSYLIGLFDNTTYYMDEVTNNDLIPEYNDSVDANMEESLNVAPIWGSDIHLWANKPITLKHDGGYEAHFLYPYSVISTTTHSLQKYLGANELTTMETRVFNPFANTTVHNLTINVSIPDSFSLPLGSDLQITVEGRYLRNDTIIEDDSVVVTPILQGSNLVFTISSTSLESMTYLNLQYQLVTPSTLGVYTFDPTTLSYEAETWEMPA